MIFGFERYCSSNAAVSGSNDIDVGVPATADAYVWASTFNWEAVSFRGGHSADECEPVGSS